MEMPHGGNREAHIEVSISPADEYIDHVIFRSTFRSTVSSDCVTESGESIGSETIESMDIGFGLGFAEIFGTRKLRETLPNELVVGQSLEHIVLIGQRAHRGCGVATNAMRYGNDWREIQTVMIMYAWWLLR